MHDDAWLSVRIGALELTQQPVPGAYAAPHRGPRVGGGFWGGPFRAGRCRGRPIPPPVLRFGLDGRRLPRRADEDSAFALLKPRLGCRRPAAIVQYFGGL